MKAAPYDIVRKDLLGTAVWMEAVQDLETAKLRIMEFAGRSPAEYFVYSQKSQEIVSDTARKHERTHARVPVQLSRLNEQRVEKLGSTVNIVVLAREWQLSSPGCPGLV